MSPEQSAATVKALVWALERKHKGTPPAVPIGTRVHVRSLDAVGTVVGRDGVGFDGLMVKFDDPAPRGYEDGCCASAAEVIVMGGTDG